MSDRVYIAYNWIGPRGPIGNIRSPDIYDLAQVETYTNIHVEADCPRETFGYNCVDYGNQVGTNYKIIPASSCAPDDTFIFPISLGHKDDINYLFSPHFGLLERSRTWRRTLELIRHCKGYLVFEHGFEAFVSDPYLDVMHNYLRYHHIPGKKVIYAAGCGNIDEIYQYYCARKGIHERDQIKFVRFFPTMESFSINENKDPHENKYDPEHFPGRRFLSLNLRPRPHRTLLLGMFHKLGLMENSYFSYIGLQPGESILSKLDEPYMEECGLDTENYHEIQTLLDQGKFYVDPDPINETDVISDCEAYDRMVPFYNDSILSVTTETTFHTDIMSVTEKSFKPIKYKHPFILVAAPNALRNMQEMGFKTFSEFWPEDYDEIRHHNTRLRRIAEICAEINTWTREDIMEFRRKVKPIVEHNYEMLVSNPYDTVYKDMYDYVVTHSKTLQITEDIQ